MKKLYLFRFVLAALYLFSSAKVLAQFSGTGSGTELDPYIITTPTQLGEMADDLTAYYRLGNDINMVLATSNVTGEFYNDGKGWDPLEEFTGSLDGNTRSIIGLFINRPDENEIALISRTGTGSEIKGLRMESVDITGNLQVGSLVGWNRLGGSISRCSASGAINGVVTVGGLAGENWNGLISESHTDVLIKSTGNTDGNDFAGGMVGINYGGTIQDCYSIGSVRGEGNKIGGISGANLESASITNTYALGYISGNSEVGGVLGDNESGSVSNSYFHLFGTDQSAGVGAGADLTGTTGLDNSAVVQQTSYTGFDFASVWTITNGQTSPRLQLNPSDPQPAPNLGPFLVGNGSEDDPWHITTIQQLNAVRDQEAEFSSSHIGGYYILMNDLDLSTATSDPGGEFYNGGLGWDPIGGHPTSFSQIKPFIGAFDGNGYTISGLTINRPEQSNTGLFARIGRFSSQNGDIHDLHLADVDITGNELVGALVGSNDGSNIPIRDISVMGKVSGISSIGGIAGGSASIERSYSAADVSGTVSVGGIIGNNGSISECYSTGEISGTTSVGGLIGICRPNSGCEVADSYSTANVTVSGNFSISAGGLIGSMVSINSNFPYVRESYATGTVSFPDDEFDQNYGYGAIGRLSGDFAISSQQLRNIFFDFSSCNIEFAPTQQGEGKQTSEMVLQATFEDFDFGSEGPWTIDEGSSYPYLKWQGSAQSFNLPPTSIADPIPDVANLADLIVACSVEEAPAAPTATDACGRTVEGTTDLEFPISEIGTVVITWTYSTPNGEVSTQTQNLIIEEDDNAPVPTAASLPDLTGVCSVEITDIPTAEDECEGTIIGVADVDLLITNQGETTITWSFEDSEGNVSTQTQNVFLDDTIDPIPNADQLADITVQCEVTVLAAPTATDNCAGEVTGVTDATLPITAQGTSVITWTYTDDNGNSVTQDQNIIIQDDTSPVPDVSTLPVVSTNCDGAITELVAPTATDNCAGAITGTTDQVLPFTPTADTQILWQFEDGNGNSVIQFQDISITQSDAVTVEESLCDGAEFTFPDGTVWMGETTQVSTLTNQQGCDSLITTNITILPLPEVDLGEDEVFGCVGEELTFSIDESSVEFTTYTISTLFGNTSTDGPLTFEFSNALAAATTTGDVFVTIELTGIDGCIGTDQVQLFDNTMINWSNGVIQNNDPSITITNAVLPITADSFEWDFGDGTTNTTDLDPTHTYTANGDFEVKLTVSNECGDESQSTIVSIAGIEDPLGVPSGELPVYPNPVSDFIYFEADKSLHYKLFSLEGKEVLSGVSNGEIDLNSIDQGQYLLHLLTGDQLIRTEKIIKTN